MTVLVAQRQSANEQSSAQTPVFNSQAASVPSVVPSPEIDVAVSGGDRGLVMSLPAPASTTTNYDYEESRQMNDCQATMTGSHMFNPRRISVMGDGRGPYVTEYRCKCGDVATGEAKKEALRLLAETATEQHRQVEEAKRLTGAKRMEGQGIAPLPGFEEFVQ